MIIKKLTLHNFGIYAGDNTFEFNGDKKVVLIGGMNGRGKTTILEAVLLSLYGSNSFAYKESSYNTYGQYLRSYVNTYDGTLKTYVELEFLLDSRDERYTVKKSWDGNKQRISEEVDVFHNGERNAFLKDNWSMFMETMLPSGLSNFFFFDGEKIAELAAEDTNDQMKESIKSLLGITVIDSLQRDLERLRKKQTRNKDDEYKEAVLDELRKTKDDTEQDIKDLTAEIEDLNGRLNSTNKKIEKAEIEYQTKGGEIYEKRIELLQERNLLAAKLEQNKERRLELSASALPLSMVGDLLDDVKSGSLKERESRDSKLAVDRIKATFKEYNKGAESKEIGDFIKYIEKQAKQESTDSIYNLSDMSFAQLSRLCDGEMTNLKKTENDLVNEERNTQKGLDEKDSFLSVEIDENKVAKIYKRILKLQAERGGYEHDIENATKDLSQLNFAYTRACSEFNKYVEGMLAKLELSDDKQRMARYTQLAIKALDEYKVRLQEKKIDALAETMTSCYKSLANKKGLIDRIVIDHVTLDISYIGNKGEEVLKKRLSAGEKQLMVVSLLWALALCSKRNLPVIIDTPLSRLDSKHRMALIETYFPNASDQTIVLSTDSEIYGKYYKKLKKNVGDEFTLSYDDEQKRTHIVKGYSWEEES